MKGVCVKSLECQLMFIIVATVVYSHQRYTKQISFFSMLHASPCCASLCIYVYCIDTFLTWLFPANQKKSISSEITKFPQSIAICNVLRHFSLCGASPSSLATAKQFWLGALSNNYPLCGVLPPPVDLWPHDGYICVFVNLCSCVFVYLCICVLVYLYAVLPHITSSRSTRGRMMATKLRAELIPGFLPKYIGLTLEKPCVSVGPFLKHMFITLYILRLCLILYFGSCLISCIV